MASNPTFEGPYLKAKRAEIHIRDLKKMFAAHAAKNKRALFGKQKGKWRHTGRSFGTPLPRHTPTILGDALHNLRASLDHAYCELVQANGCDVFNHPKRRHIKFPFTEKESGRDLEGSVQGHAKLGIGPSQAVIRHIFDVIQPYAGGNGSYLLAIHLLDIADKHMILLPTEHSTKITRLEMDNGTVISGIELVHAGPSQAAMLQIGPSVRPKRDADNQLAIEICFGRGQPFEGEPILPLLNKLHARTIETLKDLQRFL